MSPVQDMRLRRRAGLPDPRVNAFAVKTSLLSSLFIGEGLHVAWDSVFWPLFFSPFFLLFTYLVGRFAGSERYAKRDARMAAAAQAAADVRLAREAARRADASASDSETVAHDAQRTAQDRPVAADGARKAAAAAINARAAARRAGALAESAGDHADTARKAKSVEQALSAAHQAAGDRSESVAAAEEATTHNLATHQALGEATSAIAQEGATHEDLAKPLARGAEFARLLKSQGVDASRRDAIYQNIARELLPVAIALRDPDKRRLAANDATIQGLLAAIDARLSAQNLDPLPEAQLIFDALGYGRQTGPLS
jgi:hypothetical protein